MGFFRKLFTPITAPIKFIQDHFKAVIFVTIVLIVALNSDKPAPKPNLYQISLFGPILDSEQFLNEVAKASEDHIKGVLLVVDSPGGAVAPSVEMMMAVRDLASKKPVVAYSAGVMASGSYYAGIWANQIVANPGSILGSIGVIMEGINAEKLLENIGIKMSVVKAGDLKEAGAFYREWSEAEKAQLKSVINSTYKMFVEDVAAARMIDIANEKQFANGRIFTAPQALEVGLIDGIGSINDAKSSVATLGAVIDPIWNEKSEMDRFLQMLKEESISFVKMIAKPSLQMVL